MKKEKISYSELRVWKECTFKHKLIYVDNVDHFLANEYLAFGTAIHKACEEGIQDPDVDLEKIFEETFLKEISKVKDIKESIVSAFLEQGKQLCPEIFPALRKQFPEFELVSVEEQLYEDINEFESDDLKFKGFIDLVIKTPDDKYHIIDWKSCSWGWDMKKKTDKMMAYQLSFYKNYFAKKHNIDLKNIETYFILLKRTAKKNKVEILRISNAERRIKNSITLLETAVNNINKKRYIKNKLSCRRCHLYKVHCNG